MLKTATKSNKIGAIDNIQEAIAGYLEVAKKHNWNLPVFEQLEVEVY